MIEYLNGKIYKFFSNDCVYIGSTTLDLEDEAMRIVDNFRKYVKNGCQLMKPEYCVCFDSNVDIELIEKYPCLSSVALKRREKEIIIKTECINKKFKQYPSKSDDLKRLERRLSRMNEYIVCECGKRFKRRCKAAHEKTKVHINNT